MGAEVSGWGLRVPERALLDITSPDSYPAQVRGTGGLWNPRLWNPETFSGSLSILVGTAPQRAP